MKTPLAGPRKFELADVDWDRTKVWGEGGYYGRCFITRAGREPCGIVPADEYDTLRAPLGARHDDAANVTALNHRVAEGGQLALALAHQLAHLGLARDR